ncbi:MAG: histidine--tRNA ligase [Candidatus Staskawiczbacteria bacterium RIFOXYB2_FULL_32_9]|uniref:Histidine--tRNA ligase n=1 Tax=Candidatus Staskawiczbacteria bacterium RIFOXYD1_FULL_32_13 TaxID=1802234 RepID=A0A1G2JQ89_9BACT|nr:MAG: Histidine-tRNA ligase [Parcubacteria group bacterium GW2011_GWC2_32_10]OGZ78100.1 MAG: histidine--tRNA ligase [Candidatus Staskawiczbacteria bacterium RIFOXYA2_FULL_32_7]OGZ79453.1 MAG: histidine--tRNA ligase [Candidatus Staskawiczbacteria bacterium RIFOXYB1_FULL_32_11]OGZ83160.1 MAG: histidine--tRNA ligase [Candidatus Staskawiczbacteria bacterium RIFOXYB2_FULL_32_9]OGZ87234.1 MAG: histidine--tRNA ligase [Candidatus Staskawiczbacteria bacterium RIFOXYC2_FULL_32_10]OGZ89103.1 MAG: histi
MNKFKLQTLSGMHDILPDDQKYYQRVQKAIDSVVKYYGFEKIETPILEMAEVFYKGTGVTTDVVGKEMYSFKTKGGDIVALRPEFTPSIARSYIENGMHNLPQPVKLYAVGPCFRYERPQAGRYRQFEQLDLEVLGDSNPSIDGQIIQMSYDILKDLGFKNASIQVNSIGDSECRPYFKKILTSYLKSKKSSLCSDCQRRLKENPLRVLDCKEEKCQVVKAGAPQIVDHLCEACHAHFKQVLEFLDELELPYELNPYLVRGLDYYTKTVFEIIDKDENGISLGSLFGGGRYDGLVKILGGRDTPACGVACGIDRIVSIIRSKDVKTAKVEEPEIFMAQLGQMAKRKSLKLFEEFRKAKIPMAESFSKDSLRAQLRSANKMGAKWVLIFGQKEALENFVTVRDMKTGTQQEIALDKVVEEMKKKLAKK